MAKGSNNDYPSILVTEQAAKPTAPASGKQRLYMKTDHKLYHEDSGGTETEVGGGSGSIGGSTGSTDNRIIRADGTGGSTIQSSLVAIDDSGGVNIPSGQTYNINGSPHTHAGGGGDIFGFGTLTDPPAIADWTAMNTSAGWAAQVANNKLHMQHTGQGGDVLRGYYRTKPATPKVTCAFMAMRNQGNGAWQQIGLFVYDNNNNKTRSFLLNASGNFIGENWNGAGTSDAGGGSIEDCTAGFFQGPLVWMQIEEEVTNRIIRISPNGVYWIDILSEAKTTYATTTHIGFGIYDTGTQISVATLVHWKEE